MSIITSIRKVLGVALFLATPMVKEWSSHLLMLLPAIWIVIPFYAFGGKALASYALIGATINIIFSVTIFSAYEETLYDIYDKLRDFFLASPLTSFEFRTGLAFGLLLTALPSLVICLTPLFLMTKSAGPREIVVTVALLLVLWIVATLIGYLIPITKNPLATGNLVRIISFIFTVLPPIYYPLSIWPEPLRPVAYAFPTFCVAELIRTVLGLEPYSSARVTAAIIALTIEFTVIALLAYKRVKRMA